MEKGKNTEKEGVGPQTEMNHKERVQKAMKAMEGLGIPRDTTKKNLKRLWNLFNENWDFIEAENYRLLADTIFDDQENLNENKNQVKEVEKRKNTELVNESEPQSKKLNSTSPKSKPLLTSNYSTSKLDEPLCLSNCPSSKLDENARPNTRSDVREQRYALSSQTYPKVNNTARTSLWQNKKKPGLVSIHESRRANGEQPLQRAKEKKHTSHQKASKENGAITVGVSFKEPRLEQGKTMVHKDSNDKALTDYGVGPSISNDKQLGFPISVRPLNQYIEVEDDQDDGSDGISALRGTTELCLDITGVSENAFSNFEITSSPSGEVSISLSCSRSCCKGSPSFHMPSLDAVLRLAGDRCTKSHKIINANVSLVELMEELCQYFLQLSTNPSVGRNFTPMKHLLKNPHSSIGPTGCDRDNKMAAGSTNELQNGLDGLENSCLVRSTRKLDSNAERKKREDQNGPESSSLASNHIEPHELHFDKKRPPHNLNDISKGEERVKIPVVGQTEEEKYPPFFHYISHNATYQNAYINFSLARIGDEDSCSQCFGNCLTSCIPCECTKETGGVFAYTTEGNLTSEFLDKCILRKRTPNTQYCDDCPLERSKNGFGKCKGHITRNFIKECWSKCGCDKQCGNRVVQRGITLDLQVFLTPEGKGWGLRTVVGLPKGTFVCEYVGEILTNIELFNRNEESTGTERHTYPVLLDADWFAEDRLEDEEALCLDATRFGNVARFINHRCVDSNLIEIPVEIETPDHHYYHIAFFTRRPVAALEELTWDYGIDFADHDHPIKAFRCQCGSEHCRDILHLEDKNGPTRLQR